MSGTHFVVNGSAQDHIHFWVKDIRARMWNWLIHYTYPPGHRRRLMSPPQHAEAAQMLAEAEAAGAVPADVALAWRELLAAWDLTIPPGEPTEEDVARLEPHYLAALAWFQSLLPEGITVQAGPGA